MIELKDCSKDLWREISNDEKLKYCFTCGTCVAGCPASNADPPLLIRSLVRKVVFGLEDEILDDDTPWICVTCSKCEEMCPMGVEPFELCLAVRRWQCRNDETRIPPAAAEIYERGYTQAVERVGELRASVGLTEKLPTITEYPELLDKFRKMLMKIETISENSFMFEV